VSGEVPALHSAFHPALCFSSTCHTIRYSDSCARREQFSVPSLCTLTSFFVARGCRGQERSRKATQMVIVPFRPGTRMLVPRNRVARLIVSLVTTVRRGNAYRAALAAQGLGRGFTTLTPPPITDGVFRCASYAGAYGYPATTEDRGNERNNEAPESRRDPGASKVSGSQQAYFAKCSCKNARSNWG
jgi:hypothetical protein